MTASTHPTPDPTTPPVWQARLNGHDQHRTIDPAQPLAHCLREEFGLRGIRVGCANGDCGSCTALVDQRPVKTCLIPAGRAEGTVITTLEGMGSEANPSPVQDAFVETYAFQCGFCLPGMVFTAKALLDRDPDPSECTIRNELSGNICRCTGYHNIVAAVRRAAELTRASTSGTNEIAAPTADSRSDPLPTRQHSEHLPSTKETEHGR